MSPLITVWRIPLLAGDKVLAKMQSLLSDEESSKAAQYKSDLHRQRYIVRHGAMRQILSRELQCAPDELCFIAASHGKPSLENPFGHVQFNLTHSADMALLAVCQCDAVGVDIEAQRALVDLDRLVTEVCSSAEARLIVDSAETEQMFYRCWVGKEAVLKCLGLGLNGSINELGVLDAQGQVMSSPVLPLEWRDAGVVDLKLLDELPPGFIGAISVLQKGRENRTEIKVRMHDWVP